MPLDARHRPLPARPLADIDIPPPAQHNRRTLGAQRRDAGPAGARGITRSEPLLARLPYALRRLSLGLALIALASTVLLVADWGRRVPSAHPDTDARPRQDGGPATTPSKVWQLSFVEFNNVLDVEESEQGVLEGLREAGLVEGRDFRYTVRNAQGDMATVSGLIDAALTEGTDLLVTFSTPTLQAAIQRAGRVPIVFTYVASAIAAGAGTSDTDHLPNVTGVYMRGAFEQMLSVVKECLPSARRLGTIYVPSEVNMVVQRDGMLKEAARMSITFDSMGANSPSEVSDAALALATSGIDAICQLPGNLTASAFPGIAQAALQARLPVFVFQSSQLNAGATVALARDYHEAGADAARLIARIVRGESPAAIPFVSFEKTKLLVNLDAARRIGFTVPPALLARADAVIGR